jgi:hypothetical protein
MKKIGLMFLFALLIASPAFATVVVVNDTTPTSTDSSQYMSLNDNQRETLLINKLTPDQLIELERIRATPHYDNPLGSGGIVLISLMPFITAIFVVFLVMRYKRQNEQQRFRLFEKAIEAGKDLPDSFFRKPESEAASNLLKGLIWTGVGIGIAIGAYDLMGEHSPWGFGLIPALIGIAYLVSYYIEQRAKKNAGENE